MNKQERWLAPETLAADAAAVDAHGYESLVLVLKRAFLQASQGKGKERHAQGAPFDRQPMQSLIDLYGPGFALGQAAKKMQEAQRLPDERAVAELLGAINYIAGAVIAIERDQPVATNPIAANDNGPLFKGPLVMSSPNVTINGNVTMTGEPQSSEAHLYTKVDGEKTGPAHANDNTPRPRICCNLLRVQQPCEGCPRCV